MDSKTMLESLAERIKTIQENKDLWCPLCKKFTPYKDLTFHGKNEKGEKVSSFNYEDIFEYEGFVYACSICNHIHEGKEIGRIEV